MAQAKIHNAWTVGTQQTTGTQAKQNKNNLQVFINSYLNENYK